MKNFYPKQYQIDSEFNINHNYLKEQFSDYKEIFNEIEKVVRDGDYTLGESVNDVEELIAREASTKYAIGVGSGTDAIFLSLKALGIGAGDEVITTTYTFYATIGAIVTAGARPVFCDIKDEFNINPDEIVSKINSKTKAIIPVHWAGRSCEMEKINKIASDHNLYVVEDACHAIQAEYKFKRCGSLGDLGCFSFHPLKNLNVWGDGGIITTSNEDLANKLKLIRNHGLINRNTCVEFAYNSRLDTIQAVIARYLINNKLQNITDTRIKNAHFLDKMLEDIPQINHPKRSSELKEVFHLYVFKVENRDGLYQYLRENGIDAKIHYPVPMHLQPAAKAFGYKIGDFPVAELTADQTISLPVHEFISFQQIEKMSTIIHKYYSSN
tara:strand:- start:1436 stop:2584 length:1149 start_codon:yes stop_codon:yes gene_type:complete